MGEVRRQLTVDPGEIQHRCDTPNLMVIRYRCVKIERIEQLDLLILAPPHHRTCGSTGNAQSERSGLAT